MDWSERRRSAGDKRGLNYVRRWNGWGDQDVRYPLAAGALGYLAGLVGNGVTPRDAALGDVVRRVPRSRLPAHPLVVADPEERLRHALGQSLPDWIAARSGNIPAFPDGVAYPETGEQVRSLIDYASGTGARVIPYGGGTSVVGHINPPVGELPVLTVDMGRMSSLLELDEASHLARFGAGVSGPQLETVLGARGYTLGHYPQSFEYSTLGGWIHARSSGQLSLGYGRIERLFAGGRLETPRGEIELPPFPASAAGPDLRELILGSEGRLGIMTEAIVRISPLPETQDFQAIFFPDFERGVAAVKDMARARLPLCMLRLSTPGETRTTLAMAGHERLVSLLERYLALRGAGTDKCLLVFGAVGSAPLVRFATRQARVAAGDHGGVYAGRTLGKEWFKNRFRTPYLRNTLWEAGYAVDTLETAVTWDRVVGTVRAIESALTTGLLDVGERVHAFSHLSHVYPHGSSIYTTYVYRIAPGPGETLWRWKALKGRASEAIVAAGGTISHQHGVGTDHLPYLAAEKGRLGMEVLAELAETLDPLGLMNPGKLIRGR